MTEAIHNHGSADIQLSDINSYLEILEKRDLTVHKDKIFVTLKRILSNYESNPNDSLNNDYLSEFGLFKAANGKLYQYHFWFYSMLNVPARAVLGHLKADLRITFLATNLLLLLAGVYFIFSTRKLSVYKRVIAIFLLIFSPVLWYLDWAHAELYGGVLAFLGVFAFFNEKKYSALLFFSLSSMHYPPLFIPAVFVFIQILIKNGFKIQVLTKLFFASFWIILPAMFYYYHFGKINLIADLDYLSTDYVNLTRLHGFFFDLNQGMILVIPAALLLSIGFFIYDLIKRKHLKSYWPLASILLMSLFFMQMKNWNHDHAVANRYVVWNGTIIVAWLFYRLNALKNWKFYTITSLIIVSQIVVIFTQQDFNKIYWPSLNYNKLSIWVMSKYPKFYNPEPIIFRLRHNSYSLSSTDSVLTFVDGKERITKMLVKEGSISQLIQRGVSPEKVKELESSLDYYDGYTYVNKDDLDRIGYRQDSDTLISYIENLKLKTPERRDYIKNRIIGSKSWMEIIEKQSVQWDWPQDSVIEATIDYVIRQESDYINR